MANFYLLLTFAGNVIWPFAVAYATRHYGSYGLVAGVALSLVLSLTAQKAIMYGSSASVTLIVPIITAALCVSLIEAFVLGNKGTSAFYLFQLCASISAIGMLITSK